MGSDFIRLNSPSLLTSSLVVSNKTLALTRFFIFIYIFFWNVEGFFVEWEHAKHLIYMTIWSFFMLGFYFFLTNLVSIQHTHNDNGNPSFALLGCPTPEDHHYGVCHQNDEWERKLTALEKLTAAVYFIIAPMVFVVSIVFWTALWRGHYVSPMGFNAHFSNSVVMIVELCLNRMPLPASAYYLLLFFMLIFGIWSGIYFAFWDDTIYPILDYSHHLALAFVAMVILLLLGFGIQRAIGHLSRRRCHKRIAKVNLLDPSAKVPLQQGSTNSSKVDQEVVSPVSPSYGTTRSSSATSSLDSADSNYV
eukprot:GCRY01000510.1.p1 GENE.GCRY01000510.1~~GCRY01000510.1.p1  ORF type:complete len:306 (+),score=31.70 GCRY01000510.1:184-1101(+)